MRVYFKDHSIEAGHGRRSLRAGAVIVSARVLARFYGEPRLTRITEVSALTFVVCALSSQHNTPLRRAMKFKELAAVEVGANLLSAGGAITMALCGLEYWALVLRPVMLASFIAFGAWLRCRWVPGRPAMSVGTKEMLRHGRCGLLGHRFYRGFK